MKLKDCRIIWIEDTEMYVADIDLYMSAEEFLKAVLSRIYGLIDSHSEEECGWLKSPNIDEYLPKVTTAYMRHAIASEPEWLMEYEPGKGRRKVWSVDFST